MATTIARMPERRRITDNDPEAVLRQDLLSAFHIMDLYGHPSGLGAHLTARLPGAEAFFFHIHNYGFGEVTPDHIHQADFELNVLTGDVDINPTLHIHTQIYKSRPDVVCVAHTHSKHVSALSAIRTNLAQVVQGAARFYQDCVLFDEDDGVALGKGPGDAIAGALGDKSAMVLKNHGLLTVGTSIPEAVILANSMEDIAEIQLLAMAAGPLDLQSDDGAVRTRQYLRSDKMIMRGWAYWMRKLARERPEILNM